MELTPVRVRRKRRQLKHFSKGQVPSRSTSPATPQDTQPAKKQRRDAPPTLSQTQIYLERVLPLELLERIFILSENPNFARSSPRIGRMLSSSAVLLDLVIAAFSPTWSTWFGCLASDLSTSYGCWYDDDDLLGGDPVFQVSHTRLNAFLNSRS